MAGVASRNWRHAKAHKETRHEVKHVLPPEVAQAIDIMRQEIAQLKAAANDHETRIVELYRLLSTHTHETIRAVA